MLDPESIKADIGRADESGMIEIKNSCRLIELRYIVVFICSSNGSSIWVATMDLTGSISSKGMVGELTTFLEWGVELFGVGIW